jgi:hypothetical protein
MTVKQAGKPLTKSRAGESSVTVGSYFSAMKACAVAGVTRPFDACGEDTARSR